MNPELFKELVTYLDSRFKMLNVDGKQLALEKQVCYTASRIVAKIMRRLGYDCHERRISYLVGNDKGKEIFLEQEKKGIYDKEEMIRQGGWMIGVGLSTKDLDDHHWVVYFPNEREVLDITFAQTDRPMYGIKSEPFWTDEDELPDCILRAGWVTKDENRKGDALWFSEELKKWREDTIDIGYRLLKKYKRRSTQ